MGKYATPILKIHNLSLHTLLDGSVHGEGNTDDQHAKCGLSFDDSFDNEDQDDSWSI